MIEHDVVGNMDDPDLDSVLMTEIDKYLRTQTTSDVKAGLSDFPYIRKLYLKFNSIRSTEAICERLFSYAGKFFE